MDSDHYGRHHVQETTLTSSAVDLSARKIPALQFGNDLKPGVNATATADISVDDGRTWTNVWKKAGFPGARGPEPQVVPLPQAAGKAKVRVRFQYLGQLSGWWAVDDVFFGDRVCAPVQGALLVGAVTAAGEAIEGATVSGESTSGLQATTGTDGVYSLFSPDTGQRKFTASKAGYTSGSRSADLHLDQVTRLDFPLEPSS
ncbi:carboxypeptidase-like regulatory domain-containing protein [Streptosporangium sp. NBC_01756]|uniref:carboxypeptidase-like regulatory domain-containing protein n=1 Tax=Streptosporangium sp. NBC_01756 TaxID=2975950 RepID=UPI002DD999F0|nr:carboxypeptidase-like regulatory domain-containing protein [Streptosporangium sp. NBC_01756]WSC87842.1 carboxypeptidase-like regulatory domain-containing protein [Streptosporangium sp. NBC_01756]